MPSSRFNYDSIKTYATQHGLRVADLTALHPKNDPFYVGRPSDVRNAEWFAGLWKKFGYGAGVHLRRVHYALVSQPKPQRADGQPYENTINDWNFLCEAGKSARYLGLVDAEAFVDRRNPEAKTFFTPPETSPETYIAGADADDEFTWIGYAMDETLPGLPDLPDSLPDRPWLWADGYEVGQPVMVEIWCEKTTMNDVLEPMCQRHGLNLVTGAGEMSITAVVDFMRRVEAADRPARILYVSDFDPAGYGMPVSVARKIEHFQRNEGFGHLDIALEPVVLTAEQVAQYNLPRVPVKNSDLRKKNWEAVQGQGAVELDALEALHPGVLAQILQTELERYQDRHWQARANEVREEFQAELDEITSHVWGEYESRINLISAQYSQLLAEYAELNREYIRLVTPLEGRYQALSEKIQQLVADDTRLTRYIGADLAVESVVLDVPPIPEPDLPDEPARLYQSNRRYTDQLTAYKRHRNGDTNGTH